MLRCTTPELCLSFAVYYRVFGILPGDDCVVRDILWSGPYPDLKSALEQAELLKNSHQNDPEFVVKIYKLEIIGE